MCIGVFGDYDKYVSDYSNSKVNEGTHLLKSIDSTWRDIVLSNASSRKIDWNSILVQSIECDINPNMVSKLIAKYMFGDAFTEKLQSIVHEGVIRACRELKRTRHLSNDA